MKRQTQSHIEVRKQNNIAKLAVENNKYYAA